MEPVEKKLMRLGTACEHQTIDHSEPCQGQGFTIQLRNLRPLNSSIWNSMEIEKDKQAIPEEFLAGKEPNITPLSGPKQSQVIISQSGDTSESGCSTKSLSSSSSSDFIDEYDFEMKDIKDQVLQKGTSIEKENEFDERFFQEKRGKEEGPVYKLSPVLPSIHDQILAEGPTSSDSREDSKVLSLDKVSLFSIEESHTVPVRYLGTGRASFRNYGGLRSLSLLREACSLEKRSFSQGPRVLKLDRSKRDQSPNMGPLSRLPQRLSLQTGR